MEVIRRCVRVINHRVQTLELPEVMRLRAAGRPTTRDPRVGLQAQGAPGPGSASVGGERGKSPSHVVFIKTEPPAAGESEGFDGGSVSCGVWCPSRARRRVWSTGDWGALRAAGGHGRSLFASGNERWQETSVLRQTVPGPRMNQQNRAAVTFRITEGYLSKVLRNYTEQACEGDFLSVRCPPRTTITVQSAFYGRRGASDPQQCPQTYQALLSSYNAREDVRYCSVSTALQKMLDECQDRRSCQVLVNSRVFGTDQCPGISKYLIVWYKCRPNEYKSKVVCEEDKMRLSCKRGMQIAVYSAMFGRTQQGTLECPLHHRRAPSVDCQSSVALQVVTARCQGKKSCLVRASTRDFGDPCYSGTRKYLSVIYTCVPKKLLQEQSPRPPVFSPPPSAHDPNIVGDGPPEGSSVKSPDAVPDKKIRETNPNEEKASDAERGRGGGGGGGEEESVLRPRDMNPIINSTPSANMALISNALAAFTYVSDHPERAALFFVCGVCLGLFLTLFALVVQISCRTDCKPRKQPPAKKRPRPADSSSDSSDSDSDWDTTSDLSARRHRRFERTLNMNVFTSAEELERAQRLEERERIIREIWMNGQPDIPGTRSLNRYY